jgi:cell division initiation protein
MKITPLDIQQKSFGAGFRGYARGEVEAFLSLVSAEFEEVVRENISLREDLKRREQRLAELLDREKALQETMVTAQRITEDMKVQARKEAEIVVSEAELQAERIVQNAHQRLIGIVDEINELKRQRAQFEAQVRSALEAHLKLLEVMRVDGPAARAPEDKVSFLPPGKKTAASEG